MNIPFIAPLPHRAILAVGGDERALFLHNLLSCAITTLVPGQATWGALLTPQGKFLHDVFVFASQDTLFLDCERDRLEDLFKRLKRYRLRAKVTLTERPEMTVSALWGAPGPCTPLGESGLIVADPRLAEAGWRLYGSEETFSLLEGKPATALEWDRHRIALGLPDGSRDLTVEGATLLENGFAELHGIDFKKGCYVGQEVTARMWYRGLTKKRLLPVHIRNISSLPPVDSALRDSNGNRAGALKSLVPRGDNSADGLALIRLSALDAAPFSVLDATDTPVGDVTVPPLPAWIVLPKTKKG